MVGPSPRSDSAASTYFLQSSHLLQVRGAGRTFCLSAWGGDQRPSVFLFPATCTQQVQLVTEGQAGAACSDFAVKGGSQSLLPQPGLPQASWMQPRTSLVHREADALPSPRPAPRRGAESV